MGRLVRIGIAVLLIALAVPTLVVLAKRGCDVRGGCALGERSYGIRSPWTSGPHPLVVFLPGSFLTGEDAVTLPELYEATDEAGFILVAPTATVVEYRDGRQGTGWRWDGEGFEADRVFIEEVIADVATRHRIDRRRIMIAGYSSGGVFALYLACTGRAPTDRFATHNAAFVAGVPNGCGPNSAPFWLHHTHARADETVPMAGGGTSRRGVAWQPTAAWMAALADAAECGEPMTATTPAAETTRYRQCRGGSELVLSAIDGGHDLDGLWLSSALDWFDTTLDRPAAD